MASRGPFSSKPSEIATAKAYLASRGLTVQQRPGTSAAGHAKQVQRIANQTYKQEQAGLAPNKQAARGHVTTPEHKGRAAPKLQPTKKAPGATPAPIEPTRPKATKPRDYQRINRQPNQLTEFPDGQRVYSGSEAYAREAIKDAAFLGGRVDMEVQFADGSTVRLFVGADHKRNGEHAIDAEVLKAMLAAHGNDLEALVKTVLSTIEDTTPGAQSRYKGVSGGETQSGLDAVELLDILEAEWEARGGIVRYTVTFYPYA